MTSQFPIEFKQNAAEPVACLKAGWNHFSIIHLRLPADRGSKVIRNGRG